MPTPDDFQALRQDPAAKAEQQRQWHAARRRSKVIYVALVALGLIIVGLIGAALLFASMATGPA